MITFTACLLTGLLCWLGGRWERKALNTATLGDDVPVSDGCLLADHERGVHSPWHTA